MRQGLRTTRIWRVWVAAAAINGFLGVAGGAVAAHAPEGRFSPQALAWLETAAGIGAVHAAALLGVAALHGAGLGRPRLVASAGWAFVVGTALFCGGLYAMALGAGGLPRPFVPIGGACLLAGWAMLLAYALLAGSESKGCGGAGDG